MSKAKITDKWIDKIISKGTLIGADNLDENQLSKILIQKCYDHSKNHGVDAGILLASAFDLLVSAEYYGFISHNGWLYCPSDTPRVYFHYTNCCPKHVLDNQFHFHPSNKPTSGKIGTATAKLLLLFINDIFKFNNLKERVFKGPEPVDAFILNDETDKVLFAEIKASPLLTLSLAVNSERLTREDEGEVKNEDHISIVNSHLYSSEINILIPKKLNGSWVDGYYPLGKKENDKDFLWAFRGLKNLIESDDSFLTDYFNYWIASLNSYHPKQKDRIFWLINACGTPSPIPKGWKKRRNGGGFESVSDSKTSVGMDRTDDIKKGIYQVLKLGAAGKPTTKKWDYKVGIISNIHPARHFESYLSALKDVIWTNDTTGGAKQVSDLPQDQKVYNLFDGIVALTSTYSRDSWIDELFITPLKS